MAIVDWLLGFIYDVARIALMALPDSPFQTAGFISVLEGFQQIMAYINYFVPFGSMLAIMSLYISAVILWYIVRWVLRLAQYID